jgi:hypothetical protein
MNVKVSDPEGKYVGGCGWFHIEPEVSERIY